MNNVILANGLEMPSIGLGTYPLFDKTLNSVIESGYEAGYRLIDTADNYYNEKDLGQALLSLYAKTDAKRKDMFLVSKISDELYHPSSIGGGANRGVFFWKNSSAMQKNNAVRDILYQKLENTLNSLHTDYLNLWLMHWPYPDYFEEIWSVMEEIYKEGRVKAIGVCNCRERHFEKLKKSAVIKPMVNQFETSPLNTKELLINYCKENSIEIMVYSPLMSMRYLKENKKYDAILMNLSKKYKKNYAQIILKFDTERGLIPIPKSVNPFRLKENISLDDFSLTQEDFNLLKSCNINLQTLPESKSCPGL